MRWLALLLAAGCSGQPEPAQEPVPVVVPEPAASVPDVAWRLPEREGVTPFPLVLDDDLKAARGVLAAVVHTHARDPDNPWAVGHALLVEGPELVLDNGEPAIAFLFGEYAEEIDVSGQSLVRFPRFRGEIRIEPHSDLLLKALTEIGVDPADEVTVAGNPHTVGDLYKGSLARAWVDGAQTSFDGWNDTPWALQGITAWAPEGLAWTAEGGHPMTADDLTSAVVGKLGEECAFIREALAAGEAFEKRGQGIFAYTCGGAHLYQGTGYAVARGFGTEADAEAVRAQVPGLFARLDVELAQVDAALTQHPDYALILLGQRLKFTGHFLETTHKLAAMGVYEPDEAQRADMARAADELVATVAVLNASHVLEKLADVRASSEQVYLDFVGDSAHAVRGIDLATGTATVRY